jgi:hypothetical protein
MFMILFVLILAAVVWIALKPAWLPKPPENQVTESISKNANMASESVQSIGKSVVTKSGGWIEQIKTPFKKQAGLGPQLKTWAGQLGAEHLELSAWLSEFSDDAATQLGNDLSIFCSNQNLELAWLFAEKTDIELKAKLQNLVVLYCQALLIAVNAKPLASLQQWLAAPNLPRHHNFTKEFFTRLLGAGLVSVPGELLLASDEERERHAIQSIQTALVENRAATMALLNGILASEEPAKVVQPETAAKKIKNASEATLDFGQPELPRP